MEIDEKQPRTYSLVTFTQDSLGTFTQERYGGGQSIIREGLLFMKFFL